MTQGQRGDDGRPSPDALLAEVSREEKGRTGRLKIFVGAAPGVGKTYAMLEEARAKRKEGIDVLVGVVETHGRMETEALLEGLELLPRRQQEYGRRTVREFDLDAALKRRPGLILVDELAHTNVTGSRHPKRYQDVEELLAAGIDVYTTINIQHIESLNDVVAQITRIRVREIVPDAMLERAEAIELVDLTPEDLIQRLKDGKVYVPRQAERALQHYFSPANLTALRELALRRTAEHVDERLVEQMQARAISGPWPANERILVCINEEQRAPMIVRHGKRLADRLRAPWTVLSLETGRSLRMSEEEKGRLAETLRLAERMGADEVVTVPGRSPRIADDVIAYAQRSNCTRIVVGMSSRSRRSTALFGSGVEDLVRRAGRLSVVVVPDGGGDAARGQRTVAVASAPARPDAKAFALAALAIAIALAVGLLMQPLFGLENIDLIFLTAIVAVAVRSGLWPSLFACLLASLSYNFFFLPPTYTFTITEPTNIAAFVLFILLGTVVSNMAASGRRNAVVAQERVRATESLYAFSRKLAAAGVLDDILWATAYQIASMLRVEVVVLLPEAGALSVRAGYPPEDELPDADMAAARWAYDKQQQAGRGSDTLPGTKWLFLPLRTGRGPIGILGITRDEPGPLVRADQSRLLDALADQSALAIERVHLVEEFERARHAAEADRLRSALLTSVSHDLKTPLAAVLGAAGALRDIGPALDDGARAELLATIIEEAERLNRFIANLLDMTKLEAGAVLPKLTPLDPGEVVGAAVQRGAKILAEHKVEIRVEPGVAMVLADPLLLEQSIFNLLDNARKYSAPGTTVRIEARAAADQVEFRVIDEGAGIAADDIERIFDKFYRTRKGDQVRAGTGLGLAIARGFVEGMKGTLAAANRTDRAGAVFTIRLPAQAPHERAERAA